MAQPTYSCLFAAIAALSLIACGQSEPAAPPAAGDASVPSTSLAADQAPAPTAEPASVPAATDGCSTTVGANDIMQYDTAQIVIPASCTEFTVHLTHTGQLPVGAMGHNLVITKTADMEAVNRDGAGAGLDGGYLKADDPRVIAHTGMIGGGERTSVTFPVSTVSDGAGYSFFCSYPGHIALMKGTVIVQ